ncbi:hypothetical protein F443_13487 [Phytophthora nicotianae P1569]|uniref:Uncharacterized protein n=1 Tax=Phytophthora nicotianae P1569 TaxID=1317065 RepID=V9EPW6_PHYNI|nr:hypothetical protein F443_13487 [Phytophthora nicotianae P1569]
MHALLEEDDETAILKDAFALIDACDGFTSEGDSNNDSMALGKHGQVDKSKLLWRSRGKPGRSKNKVYKPVTKTMRIRRPETSSTAFQRRKKAELGALRAEAAVLEIRLSGLKQKNQNLMDQGLNRSETDTRSGHSDRQTVELSWLEEAVKQYRCRLAAEQCNRTLRDILATQSRISCELRAVLYQRDALKVSTYAIVAILA